MAIVFILGFMPFAVAFVSNAGSSSEEAWINSMESFDDPLPQPDDSLWLENGGSNLTSWYSNYAPPANDDRLDCAYVTNGVCEGVWEDTGPSSPELYKGLSYNHAPYPFSYYSSRDYFEVRSSVVHQSHFAPGFNNQYAGKSGSEVFSWYLSSKFNNEINQGQTVDALRYWMTSGESYQCNSDLFNNITFEGEITFHYDNQTLKYTNFDFEKFTKFQYSALDEVHGDWEDVCAVGFFVEFDFTGFESLEIHTFNNIGDWDNTSITLTLKNFVNQNSPENFGTTPLPFAGANYWNLGVQHREVNPVEAGFLIKSGTLVLSVITLAVALVSTPYWDPFRNFFRGALE